MAGAEWHRVVGEWVAECGWRWRSSTQRVVNTPARKFMRTPLFPLSSDCVVPRRTACRLLQVQNSPVPHILTFIDCRYITHRTDFTALLCFFVFFLNYIFYAHWLSTLVLILCSGPYFTTYFRAPISCIVSRVR